jgi:putative tryptophan/tyrosine transport system substrate-binding protein
VAKTLISCSHWLLGNGAMNPAGRGTAVLALGSAATDCAIVGPHDPFRPEGSDDSLHRAPQVHHAARRRGLAWPLAARAQQAGKLHRIGFLGSATAAGSAEAVESLRTGLREFGHVEGTNVGIEFRWAEGIYDRLPQLVAELIATHVDVLITHGTPGTRVAKQATTTIPIVMAISGDAIATGLVSSLARPEANLTGSTFFLPQLNAKRLELLKEACPHISRPAALSNPDNPVSRPIIPAMQAAAASLSLIVEVARAQSPSEFSLAFAAMAKSRVDSVVVTEDGEFAASFRAIATLALANKLPSIGAREYAEAGGLIGYGVNILGLYRRTAYFVDRILKRS